MPIIKIIALCAICTYAQAVTSSLYAYANPNGTDDGKRCPECGAATFFGGRHLCRPRGRAQPKPQVMAKKITTIDSPFSADPGKDFLSGATLSEMQKKLPPFGDDKVLGIEIYKTYRGYQLRLKLVGKFGKYLYYGLDEASYPLNKNVYAMVSRYYQENVLSLPVLPLSDENNSLSVMSEESVNEITRILESIKNDRENAQANIAKRQKESLRIFNALGSLFGRKLYEKPSKDDDLAVGEFPGEQVRFKANDEYGAGECDCFYLVTPKSNRIYEIFGCKANVDEKTFALLQSAIELKIGTSFKPLQNGQVYVDGINNKGNARYLTLSYSNSELELKLIDKLGLLQAKKENAQYLASHDEVKLLQNMMEKSKSIEGCNGAEPLDSLFGVRLGMNVAEILSAKHVNDGKQFSTGYTHLCNLCGERCYSFTPVKPFVPFDKYYVDSTPLSHQVYRIYAIGGQFEQETIEIIKTALKKKYEHPKVTNMLNGYMYKYNSRTLQMCCDLIIFDKAAFGYNESDRICLIGLFDSALAKIAEEEQQQIKAKKRAEWEKAQSSAIRNAVDAL